MSEAKAFLLDMDGTFYLGDSLLPGALEFLEHLNHHGLPFSFLTNNSSRSKQDYVNKLTELGVRERDARVFTAGDATIAYLKKHHSGSKVFLLGTPSLAESFRGSDVVAGAAVGCIFGHAVSRYNLRVHPAVSIEPVLLDEGAGVQARARF